MISSRMKAIAALAFIVLILTSCSRGEDMVNDNQANQVKTSPNKINQEKENQTNQSIKVSLKSITQEEYDKWVVLMYEG